MLKGIEGSDELMVLVSSKALESAWIHYEVVAAHLNQKRIVIVTDKVGLDALAEKGLSGPFLKNKRIENLNDFEKIVDQVVERARNSRSRGKK